VLVGIAAGGVELRAREGLVADAGGVVVAEHQVRGVGRLVEAPHEDGQGDHRELRGPGTRAVHRGLQEQTAPASRLRR
jgi:hypothetical protein